VKPGGRIVIGDVRAYIQRLIKAAAAKAGPAVRRASRARPAPSRLISRNGVRSQKAVTPLRRSLRGGWRKAGTRFRASRSLTRRISRALNELRKKFAAAYEEGRQADAHAVCFEGGGGDVEEASHFQFQPRRSGERNRPQGILSLGIAVDTEQGLMVPVIRDVDKKSVLDLAKELEQLAAKARDRKFPPTNEGRHVHDFQSRRDWRRAFHAHRQLPEVAILGLGRGAMKPVVRDGKVEIRMMTPLALSYDHRVIDGGSAARFIVDLVEGV
jgi:pyruvate dehydrogenase E2 component (dihydrolipoamide acetyltransferase)